MDMDLDYSPYFLSPTLKFQNPPCINVIIPNPTKYFQRSPREAVPSTNKEIYIFVCSHPFPMLVSRIF